MKNNGLNPNQEITAWHCQTSEIVLSLLQATSQGLTQQEVGIRQQHYGANCLSPLKIRSAWMRFLSQFHNVLIYVLLAAALVTVFLQQWVDTAVIIGVVIINALIGFVQEGKAEQALDAIRKMLSPEATVLRDGHRRRIAAEELVPGDVVMLQSGDKVPADLRLIGVKNLRIEEAALTGESEAVEKSTAPVKKNAELGDRFCMAYSGTLVAYGQGIGVVVATGDTTEIGHVNAMLRRVDVLETPLLRQMAVFGRWLTVVIVVLAASLLLYGLLLHDYTTGEIFTAAVSIAVAAIPEGLPAIMTITLALGVRSMAWRHAIIRRLPAVETLGSVTIICSDKTGTLTRNEMTVQQVITADRSLAVSGIGYVPRGGFTLQDEDFFVTECPEFTDLFRVALLCNDAQLKEEHDNWSLVGDPTEGALLALAMKAGFDPVFEQATCPRIDTIPFESEHRFMATLHHDHTGRGFIYWKGALEAVLTRCESQRTAAGDQPLDKDFWQMAMDTVAAQGQRILALAVKYVEVEQTALMFEDVSDGFVLLGLVGIVDPPREESIAAVTACRSAGIQVKMITGDHVTTAKAIGLQLGIGDGQAALTGGELDRLDDQQLAEAVRTVDVFARASPAHKLRLVEAMQANGEIVAMTGDGVNDAPALRRADIGVAMGRKGTEVAKEAAEMVITDDNFASIIHAVEEGRRVYDNIRKTIIYTLAVSGGQAAMLGVAILLGVVLPITPVQILWVNMVTAVTLSMALAFEQAEPAIMQRPPRDPQGFILDAFMLWRVGFVSILLTVGALGLYYWQQAAGASLEVCRTTAVNALVIGEIGYLFNCRYMLAPVIKWRDFVGNPYALLLVALLLILQLLFTYNGYMQQLFATAGINLAAWSKILLFGLMLFLIVETEKYLLCHFRIVKC
ncbi:MAG: cation-transporting P-type ATPase [Nitrosomonas sp.]|nr:cation-transporting P-type ATPase [Nitrosomonas sp.]